MQRAPDDVQLMTAEQAATLKRLATAGYELDAYKPNLTRAEADLRIAALTAKLKLLGEPPHTLWAVCFEGLLTKRPLHLSQSLLARGLVTIGIGCARPRHTSLDCLNGLGRYFTHPFLHSSYGAWSWLRTVRSSMAPAVAGGPAAAIASSLASIFACIAPISSKQGPA
jgi:hypothetical protein